MNSDYSVTYSLLDRALNFVLIVLGGVSFIPWPQSEKEIYSPAGRDNIGRLIDIIVCGPDSGLPEFFLLFLYVSATPASPHPGPVLSLTNIPRVCDFPGSGVIANESLGAQRGLVVRACFVGRLSMETSDLCFY